MSDLRIVAIDGPSGSGKSTVARAVAERLGLEYLDTGAMYRAVTHAALAAAADLDDADQVSAVARSLDLTLADGRVIVNGEDATAAIRGPEVTGAVSVVSAHAEVREELRDRQRDWASERGGGVMEGRDIGTVVFPDAAMKVYLTASVTVRAQRRAAEIGDIDAVAVALDIERRDAHDSGREHAPLTEAADAITIDTSDLTIDQIVDEISQEFRQRVECR